MSEIDYCQKCDRIKDVDEDCNYLGCNPELDQREVSASELYTELCKAHARLAAAEERAERLAAACKIGLGVIVRSDLRGKEPREAIAVLTAALTATPAPRQAAEREAAERAVIAAALSYYQKEYDGTVPARGMREAFQALWRTIKALGDLIATEREEAPADTKGAAT